MPVRKSGQSATCSTDMPLLAAIDSRMGFGSSVMASTKLSDWSSIASGSRPAFSAAARTQPIFSRTRSGVRSAGVSGVMRPSGSDGFSPTMSA